jgi:hypothetical protein
MAAAGLALSLAVAGIVPRPAHADEAKQSFEKGIELFKANDYQGALAEFLAAYKAKPHHAVLYNIAQCYQMTDAGADALHYYALYLEEGADFISDTRRKLVEGEIEKLKSELTPLTLEIEPAGAKVILDGKGIGKSPLKTQYVDPGEHTLVVRKQGYETHEREFVAKRGEPLEITVELKKEAKPPAVGDVKPDAGGEPDGGGAAGDGDGEAGEGGDASEGGDGGSEEVSGAGLGVAPGKASEAKVPWGAAVGTGAVALASGVAAIVVGAMNAKHNADFSDLRSEIADGTYTGEDPEGAYKDAQDKGKALNAGVGATIGVSAAAAVVTAVLIPLAIPKKKVEVKAAGAGMTVSVAF